MKPTFLKNIISHLKRWLFSILSFTPGEELLLQQFRFTIGEHYEDYEFDLEVKDSVVVNDIMHDSYKYIKDDFSTLFGLEISRGIILLFNFDILTAVYYRFHGDRFDYLIETISRFLPRGQQFTIDPFVPFKRATLDLGNDICIDLQVRKDGNTGLSLKSNTM